MTGGELPLAGGELPLDVPLAFTRVFVGLLGLIVGSFLNVVVHRVPRGESIVFPPSRCPRCGHLIRFFENVPVLSWLMLRGRCSSCRQPISWRYPGVELLTAIVFVACHERFGVTLALGYALPFAAAVVALMLIDFDCLLLPDEITLPMTFVGLLASFRSPLTTPEDALLGVLLAWFSLEGMNLAYKLVRGRDGFGGGDTKMMLMVGAFLGWKLALFTLVAGSFLGSIVGIPVLVMARRRSAAADALEAAAASASLPGETAGAEAPATEPEPEPETPPTLRELLPATLDEALPLLLVPACSAAWVVRDGSPARALAGLLAGIALAVLVHLVLRLRKLQSPLSRLLPLAGALAGMPPRPLPAAAAAAVVLAAAGVFKPKIVAPADVAAPEDEPLSNEAPPILQSELPFGVFLGAGALTGLLFGEPILSWYLGYAAGALGAGDGP